MPALPSTTFSAANMVVGRRSIIVFTPPGEEPEPVELLVDYLSHLSAVEVGSAQGLGGSGVSRTKRSWQRSRDEKFRFRCREIKKIIESFDSLTFFAKGTCTLFIRDPDDAEDTVALLSEDFACSIYRDPAEAQISGAAPTEITIVVQALTPAPVVLTPDGDTSPPEP